VDHGGSEIRTGDTVQEVGGEKRRGVIAHLHRSWAFVHDRNQMTTSGIFVIRTNNIAAVAAKGRGADSIDLSKMNPAFNRNGAGTMNPPALPKSFGRDRALDQTVTIRKGGYKGLLGIVKDTTDKDARVELHTKSKTVTVPKEFLSFKG